MDFKQQQLKERLLRERGHYCEHCFGRLATDLHHCLFNRDKRFPELDCAENYMIVCHECHMSGEVDATAIRQKFWQTQYKRYGYDHMKAWANGLPFKIKPVLPLPEFQVVSYT